MNTNKTLISIALAISLAACGGGGGDAQPSAAQPTVPVVVVPMMPSSTPQNADIVTTVSAPTYAAGTVERGAWNVLNAERAACGFGLLQQDTRLDAANTAHAKFLANLSVAEKANWGGHGEDATKPGFTGVGAYDRAVFQGFPRSASVDEIVSADSALRAPIVADLFPAAEATGAASMRRLMGTVYHLSGALHPGRFGGVGSARATTPFDSTRTFEVYRFGALVGLTDNNPQQLGSGQVASYPCAGSKHASAVFKPATESPNPFPDVTNTTTEFGTPLYLKVDAGSVLVVASASITRVSDGVAVNTRQITKSTDAAGQVGSNEFFMVPTSPLVAGVAYSVAVTGTVDGLPFTKSFTFTPQP